MKSSGRGSRRNTAIRFLTWKDMAERRKEVMDMVAQVDSWAKAGGTNRFVRLPMSLIRPVGVHSVNTFTIYMCHCIECAPQSTNMYVNYVCTWRYPFL